jgi:hypothetical protein
VLSGAERFWHDPRVRDLYRSGKEFELMHRALGFAALAILTVIPLLILVAAANPTSHRGLAGWVIYGMDLTGSSADAVTRLLSAPARVLGTTSVFSAVLVSVAGVSFAGSVQAGFERIWGLPAPSCSGAGATTPGCGTGPRAAGASGSRARRIARRMAHRLMAGSDRSRPSFHCLRVPT